MSSVKPSAAIDRLSTIKDEQGDQPLFVVYISRKSFIDRIVKDTGRVPTAEQLDKIVLQFSEAEDNLWQDSGTGTLGEIIDNVMCEGADEN